MDNITHQALVEVQERYNVKLSKYKTYDITDELSDILYEEAYREALAAGMINSGAFSKL